MIKLIALDLDGTLLNNNKEISLENKLAIQRAKEKGVKIVICTGRPIMAIRDILQELDLVSTQDYAITYNGGLVQQTATGEIMSAKQHTLADVKRIYQEFSRVGLPINPIDMEKVYILGYPENAPSQYQNIMKSLVFEERSLVDFDAEHRFNKVVSCIDEHSLNQKMALLSLDFKQQYTLMKSRPVLLEILPKGVDKGFGLAQVCQLLQITPDEVMAMGDEENDLAMLQFAHYGIAMGNATEQVKAVAKDITCSNEEHGVARAIEKYILKGE